MKETTIYLDTNILSRIQDSIRSKALESDLEALVRLVEVARINLVTSYKTQQEILKTPDKTKNYALRIVYGIMRRLPMRTAFISHGGAIGTSAIGQGAIGSGGWTEIDPLYIKLNEIFDADDAEHIFQALLAKCDYFVTFDKKTILKRAKRHKNKIQEMCGTMRLVSPEEAIWMIQDERS